MPIVRFEFNGDHEMEIPEGEIYRSCAEEIVEGKSYPLPVNDDGPPVKTVVDLGAHVGEFTIMAALRWPEAIVYAWEPNPQVLRMLLNNCARFNCHIVPKAVDVKARRDKLYFNEIGSVASTIVYAGDAPEGCYWNGVDVDIDGPEAVTRLKPEVLKIDIEGPEGVLLEAMGDAVRDIYRIYVEFHHENIRRHIDDLLFETHELAYARILQSRQGELMYVRRE